MKRSVDHVLYDVPFDLQHAIPEFVDNYNYRGYHKALKDITPSDMLVGRRDRILARRMEANDLPLFKQRQRGVLESGGRRQP